MANATEPRVDARTGTPTTGHEWDGIAELNTPLPRWWLWTFYLTILWSLAYWVVYPAWPGLSGWTNGMFGWNSRTEVAEQLQGLQDLRKPNMDKLAAAKLGDIEKNQELLAIARASGAAAFANNCAPCHGAGAQGAKGYPNLNDDDWVWGGTIDAIHQTIVGGIRSDHKDTRTSAMPRFGADKLLDEKQISDVAEHVLSLSGKSADKEAAGRGAAIFAEQCSVCHGETGTGNQELGAPNLSDAIWLYGGDKADVMQSVSTGRGGMMPQWANRLDPVTIKSLAVYVHGLGGGK